MQTDFMALVGEFTVKGECFIDIISILGNNGYATEVFTPSLEKNTDYDKKHIIKVYKESEDK